MKALIVYAHPEPKSFNGAMKDLAVETLRGRGDEVEVTDLYAMRFKAVVGADDFHGERADPEFLSIAAEQTRACETGTLASDIVTEQKKLARAEILILQFPIWWFGMPAILKGWADRSLGARLRLCRRTQVRHRHASRKDRDDRSDDRHLS